MILTGEMADWPALVRWTPEYLKTKVGARLIEFQGGRSGDHPRFEGDEKMPTGERRLLTVS